MQWTDIRTIQAIFGGFFTLETVLQAIGTDDNFISYIRSQESCFSGVFSEYVNGVGRSVPAHVRRAANSGIGYKPKYSCIPLTFNEHSLQHQKGESALRPPSIWLNMRDVYRQKWAMTELSKKIGLSGNDIRKDITKIDRWVVKNGLEKPFKENCVLPDAFPLVFGGD